jgi:hypothetical protein
MGGWTDAQLPIELDAVTRVAATRAQYQATT